MQRCRCSSEPCLVAVAAGSVRVTERVGARVRVRDLTCGQSNEHEGGKSADARKHHA